MKTRVFLHGFLGGPQDWQNITKARPDDLFIDLNADIKNIKTHDAFKEWAQTFHAKTKDYDEIYAYSLGARLALYYLCHYPKQFKKVVLFSVNPGLQDAEEKTRRVQNDLAWSKKIQIMSKQDFLQNWYEQSVFAADTSHVGDFDKKAATKILESWSLGKQENLWPLLIKQEKSWHFVVGENDIKFCSFARRIQEESSHFVHIVKGAGHRVPFFTPLDKTAIWHWEHT